MTPEKKVHDLVVDLTEVAIALQGHPSKFKVLSAFGRDGKAVLADRCSFVNVSVRGGSITIEQVVHTVMVTVGDGGLIGSGGSACCAVHAP